MKGIINPYAKGPVKKPVRLVGSQGVRVRVCIPPKTSKIPGKNSMMSTEATAANNTQNKAINAVKSSPVTPSSISKPTVLSQLPSASGHQRSCATPKALSTAPSAAPPSLSLRTKLKQDIENLKRQTLLQKQRQEEEKRRKLAEKQRRKLEKKLLAEQKLKQQQQQHEIAPATTNQLDNSTNNAAATAATTFAVATSTMDSNASKSVVPPADTLRVTTQSISPLQPELEPEPAELPTYASGDVKREQTVRGKDNSAEHQSIPPQQNIMPAVTHHQTPSYGSNPTMLTPTSLGTSSYHRNMSAALSGGGYFSYGLQYRRPQQPQLPMAPPPPPAAAVLTSHPLTTLFAHQFQQPVWSPAVANGMAANPFSQLPSSETHTVPSYLAHSNSMPLRAMARRPAKPTEPPKEIVMTPTPCQLPSPFALTHEIVPHKILLIKKPGQGFGMTVQKTMQTALVAPYEWPRFDEQQHRVENQDSIEKPLVASEIAKEQKAPSLNNQGTANRYPFIPNTRIRRKRMAFAVLQILDPSEQNKREHPGKINNLTVEPGDLVLSIHGTETAHLTFQRACALFGQCKLVQDDGYVHCEITVARRKKKTPVMIPRPFFALPTVDKSRPLRNDPLDATEQAALIKTVLQVMMDPQWRILGKPVPSSQLEESLKATPALHSRSLVFLQAASKEMFSAIQMRMTQRAVTHWKNEWQQEPKEIRDRSDSFESMTDAQRSELRALSRPAKGCRCGGQDHEYVNDPMCPLYSNVLRWAAWSGGEKKEADDLETKHKKLRKSQLNKDLNVVEKAYTDRFVRMRKEEWAQAAEATFVERMEDCLLNERGQAIYAPGLTAMVLSAIVELESEFKDRKPVGVDTNTVQNLKVAACESHDSEEDSDDDDDDDVPLAELGKRSSSSAGGSANKKAKAEATISLEYLASLLRFVSKRWGHVYREPSNVDYAWRWEVYYAQLPCEGTKWEANSRNPRREGSRSLENLHFIVDYSVVTQLQVGQEAPEAQKTLAFAIAPEMNGIYDELRALVGSGVVRVNEAGIPIISKDWYNNVDLLLLDDMDTSWGTRADPSGKHLVSERLRRKLAKTWTKTYHGWAFSDAPRDTIFDFDEFDSWRDAFEEKVQSKEDVNEGVGEFGI